jgi:hypothetical protein
MLKAICRLQNSFMVVIIRFSPLERETTFFEQSNACHLMMKYFFKRNLTFPKYFKGVSIKICLVWRKKKIFKSKVMFSEHFTVIIISNHSRLLNRSQCLFFETLKNIQKQ